MVQDIKPTRSELLKVKKQIKLAQSGYSLLKKKRDGLIHEFFEIFKKAKTLREELVEQYKIALEKINIARTLEGDLKIKSTAMAIKKIPDIKLETKNIMGVKVPKIEYSEIKKAFMERGYGSYTSAAIDETAAAYEKVVEKIIWLQRLKLLCVNCLMRLRRQKEGLML